MAHSAVVSSPAESLVLVDDDDCEIGIASKSACHAGEGKLHRAFSIFVFNHNGELLLQQRSGQKPLWPSYWSNTCCSHPRAGEVMQQAVERRLDQELGFRCALQFLYKFKYHAKFGEVGSEREFCWVYAGLHDGEPNVNVTEIADWRFVSVAELDAELAAAPGRFTPWLKLEWAELKSKYLAQLLGSSVS